MQRSCSSIMFQATWPLTSRATSQQYVIFCKISKTHTFHCQWLVVYVKQFAAVASICMHILVTFQNSLSFFRVSTSSFANISGIPSVALYSSQLPFQSHSWDCSWSLGGLGASLGSSQRGRRYPQLTCVFVEHRGTDKCPSFHGTVAAGRMWHSSAETGNQELPGLGEESRIF